MSKHAVTSFDVKQVTPFRFPAALKAIAGVFTVIGIAVFVAAALKQPERAWPAFLLNYFFFLVLALGGAFFVAVQHITNAYWSVTVRRMAEGLVSYLPVALVLGVVLFFGRNHLYLWAAHAGATVSGQEGEHAALLKQKAPYLNSTFFAIRLFVAFAIWIGLSYWMRRNSVAQDRNGEHRFTLSNIKLSAVFLPLFAVSFTLISFDLIMSLEPSWFSTIFGVYCFAGLFYGALAVLALLSIYGRSSGVFNSELLNGNHLHDVGKLMFAFTVFWAYIMFSQLMLQWYANLPEETSYYLRRFEGGWWPYFWALVVLHFVLPFLLLLPREAKRKMQSLAAVAVIMLIAQWLDAYFLVMPVFFKVGPVFGWIELGTALGFLGLFVISVLAFLSRVPSIPVRDPRLLESLAHSQ